MGDDVVLTMTRLAMVGGDFGVQPVSHENKTICVVGNGGIYNPQPLRTHLEKLGHSFSITSDVEVIGDLYESLQRRRR